MAKVGENAESRVFSPWPEDEGLREGVQVSVANSQNWALQQSTDIKGGNC